MRCVWVILLGVGLLGPALAQADVEQGKYAPDVEAKAWLNVGKDGETLSLIELRGMIVCILFFSTGSEGGGAIMADLVELQGHHQFGREGGVFVLGVTDATAEDIDELLLEHRVLFPVAVEADEAFEEYGIEEPPRLILLEPSGRIAWMTGADGPFEDEEGEPDERNFYEALAETYEEHPPFKTHPLEAQVAVENLEKARAALVEDDYRDAYEAAHQANRHALAGDVLKTRCQNMLDLIDALGRDLKARAENAVFEREYEKAVELLLEIVRSYGNADIARTAEREIRALAKKHEAVDKAVTEYESWQDAERMLRDAIVELREQHVGEAFDLLEKIVAEHGDTKAGPKARTMLKRMRENSSVMEFVRDHKASKDCEVWLAQAETYAQLSRFEDARVLYRRILADYPDTVYAKRATDKLAELPQPR
jgi:tetratricopeptide (TPR) repeat protein